MSVTFDVTDKAINNKPILSVKDPSIPFYMVSGLTKSYPMYEVKEGMEDKIFAHSGKETDKVQASYNNALVHAVGEAYNQHRPLVLSPDAIWCTLVQGLSKHIELNAEELRDKFVSHEGKEEIEVIIPGSPEEQEKLGGWEPVFNSFSDKLKEKMIGDTHELIASTFSTTTPLEKVVSEISLMDAMKSYFDYTVRNLCGLPRITITGTKEDWENIMRRFARFSEFGLDWWVESTLPIIDKFVGAFDGDQSAEFWNSIYNSSGGSGGPYISGWICQLFPYMDQGQKNPIVLNPNKEFGMFGGLTSDDFPTAISVVPFKHCVDGQTREEGRSMEFVGGMIGIEQNEDMSIQPKFGWCIKHSTD